MWWQCENEYYTDEMMTRDSDDDGDVRQACYSVVQCSVVQCENEYYTDEMMTRDSDDALRYRCMLEDDLQL